MRVAETRAVNRALRKASGIGIRWVEEIRSLTASQPTRRESKTEAMCEAPSESFTNDRPIQHESDVISVGALKMKKAGCYLGTQFLTTGERRWA